MTYISADQLAEHLKQKAHLLRIEYEGNTKVWFSNQIPPQLPIGDSTRHISTEQVALPRNRYLVTTNTLTGWMTFWRHTGPRCMAATAFISVSPLEAKEPVVDFESVELPMNLVVDSDTQWLYGFESKDYVSCLCKGLTEGLLAPYLGHPLADIRISILNALSHRVDSSAKAFEALGQWLMEAMIFEMYKRDWIQ